MEFKPERFEPVDSEDINKDPYSFVPFSAGPRNCIGQNFAQNEAKVLLARIVNRFEIYTDPDHKVEPYMDAVLKTKSGLFVRLKERIHHDV
ncbi:hypothetical protein KUTeg_010267 [Tegillarca granosa]|uniref:Cytochrome P450 n=1 Tax=Tegillarca granosa TaxID=220873 RepID=A0ABQ9F686_TEGGR|nr:hypothetical protein KUTeg_010267 [Tegillarca granosa]